MKDKIAQIMQDTAGNSWGTEAHFQRFAAALFDMGCAQIKAADDAAADSDYMLDSDDCIQVLRGEWKGPMANDYPVRPKCLNKPEAPPWWASVENILTEYGMQAIDFAADFRAAQLSQAAPGEPIAWAVLRGEECLAVRRMKPRVTDEAADTVFVPLVAQVSPTRG